MNVKQNALNAISSIQYASKDLMTDFNGGHIGSVREDIATIENMIEVINVYLSTEAGKLKTNAKINGTPKQHIVDWYVEAYPDDADIMYGANDDLSFSDLVFEMVNGKDFYDTLQVSDSVVRERVFERIAQIYGVDYNDVYSLWLGDINEISNDAKTKFGM